MGDDLVAGGLLTEANGRLEYTTSGVPTGNDVAVRPWILNFGSYTQNWEIQIDVSVPRSPYQGISLPLAVFPGTDLNTVFANRFGLELNQFQDFGDQLKFQGTVSANSAETVVGRVVTTSTSAALRIAFDANAKVLSAYYDEDGPVCGYSWQASRVNECSCRLEHDQRQRLWGHRGRRFTGGFRGFGRQCIRR